MTTLPGIEISGMMQTYLGLEEHLCLFAPPSIFCHDKSVPISSALNLSAGEKLLTLSPYAKIPSHTGFLSCQFHLAPDTAAVSLVGQGDDATEPFTPKTPRVRDRLL